MEIGGDYVRVFVTGVNGQLGHDVMTALIARGIDAIGSDVTNPSSTEYNSFIQLDITDADAVDSVLHEIHPDAIIHCAAWTAVDAAEEDDNKEAVYQINVRGTQNLAKTCNSICCKMMYISTDYVFDGNGTNPWEPDCKSYKPLNYYGLTKLQGEQAVSSLLERYFIVRIAWVFGQNGNNFVKTMLRLSENHDELRVVNDQIGTPTYTSDLARLLVDMILTDKFGYYHATNEGGYISWYDFACEIFRQVGAAVRVIPVSSQEYGLSRAKRPFNSRLDKKKLVANGFSLLPDWRDALSRYLREIGR